MDNNKIKNAAKKLLLDPKESKKILNGLTQEEESQVFKLINEEKIKANPEAFKELDTTIRETIEKRKDVIEKITESGKSMESNTSEKVLEELTMKYFVLSLILDICVKEDGITKEDYYSKIVGRLPVRFDLCYTDDVFLQCIDELLRFEYIKLDGGKYEATESGSKEYTKQTYQSIASNYLVGLESIDLSNKIYKLSLDSVDISKTTVDLTKTMKNLTYLMAVLAIISIVVPIIRYW